MSPSRTGLDLDDILFARIEHKITETDNQPFCDIPTLDEIKSAISQINPMSSLWKDAFIGYFYSAYWDIIKEDLFTFMSDFCKGGKYDVSGINIESFKFVEH